MNDRLFHLALASCVAVVTGFHMIALVKAAPPGASGSAPGASPEPLALLLRPFGSARPDGADVVRFVPAGTDEVEAIFAQGTRARARIRLPRFANGPVQLSDPASRVSLSFALRGARAAPVEPHDGLALYRSTMAGVDLIHRVRGDGAEDFVRFERRPSREEVRYRIDARHVAGLRMISGVLELLDGDGAPRLRVARPFAIDVFGQRRPAALSLGANEDGSTCTVDTSPELPWGRPVRAPCGAGPSAECWCELRVTWEIEETRYPILVDPAWTTSESMAEARNGHASSPLPSQRVLVTGGVSTAGEALASTEVFDPSSGTWAMAAPLAQGRSRHTASALSGGAVLVAGGRSGDLSLASSERYDPVSGTWSDAGTMLHARQFHVAAALSGGRVLVAGGIHGADSTDPAIASAELYHPGAGWSPAPPMGSVRKFHTANVLEGDRVIVVGGTKGASPIVALATAEIFDGKTGLWSKLPSLSTARLLHVAVVRGDGSVLVAGGGVDGGSTPIAGVEILAPGAAHWSPAPSLSEGRMFSSATLLPGERILVAGGYNPTGRLATAEILFPGAEAWAPAGRMAHGRSSHSADLTPAGLLVAGGYDGDPLSTTELFVPAKGGQACTDAGECVSGLCAAEVCCDSPCEGPCVACTAAAKGGGANGVCGPVPGNPCGAYACEASGQCKVGCATSADCAPGYTCSAAVVCAPAPAVICDQDQHTLVGLGGSRTDCYPLKCTSDGDCLPGCTSNIDCVKGFSCRVDGRCEPFADKGADGGGCAIGSSPRRGSAVGAPSIGLLLVAAGLLRRGKRARGRRG